MAIKIKAKAALADERIMLGISREEIAKAVGCSIAHYSKVENRDYGCSEKLAKAIADHVKIEFRFLFDIEH